MPTPAKVGNITGRVLSVLLAALFLFSAYGKLAGDPQAVEGFNQFGIGDWRIIIGIGEAVSAILFLIPRTAVLGLLLLSSYMGGAIMVHMMHAPPITLASVILVVVWIAGFLRMPWLLDGLLGRRS